MRRNARQLGLELSETVEFAFRRRYNLPPTDPRFLSATPEEVLVDYWAHRFWDDPKLKTEEFNPDFDDDVAALEAEFASEIEQPGATPPEQRDPPADDWDMVADDTYGGV